MYLGLMEVSPVGVAACSKAGGKNQTLSVKYIPFMTLGSLESKSMFSS